MVNPASAPPSPPFLQDTIAALATPAGTGALALIRITGPLSPSIAAALFQSPPPPRVARHLDYAAVDGALLDDVVATFFAGPRSFTGEDSLEISCHGNPFIAQKILGDLFARGCRPARPGEFSQRAFLNGRLDLSQAEAVMDVIRARSDRALAAAQRQLRGGLSQRMTPLCASVIDVLARVEAHIDFPEEDLPAEDRRALGAVLEQARAGVSGLLATSRYGEMLRDGIRTVIVGAPNVGKSSLLNRLIGHERALVADEPGTTRDFIEERLVVGHHSLRLVDTAGLNPDPGPVERRGIEKSLERVAEADLILLVLACGPSFAKASEGKDALQELSGIRSGNTLVVWNKSDLGLPGSPPPSLAAAPALAVSARTGDGIEALRGKLADLADRLAPAGDDDLVPVNARHALALETALACLGAAGRKLAAGIPDELLASDLRAALDALGEISGRIDNEAVLDRLFATFCIGK